MEFLTILLSALLAIGSPVGLVTDSVIESALRSRLDKVEQLQVRVDNTPNFQIVQGKVDRVRIAGRGLWLTPEIRVDALDVETDPINLDLQRIRRSPRSSLEQPVQAGVRLVLTESDINQALQSPAVSAQLRRIVRRLVRRSTQGSEFLNPRVEFLGNNRIRFQVELREGESQPQAVIVESGLDITGGHSLQLIEPAISINGVALPPLVVAGFATGISDRFNLRMLGEAGITARLLELDISDQELNLAAFVRVEASNQASAPQTGVRRP